MFPASVLVLSAQLAMTGSPQAPPRDRLPAPRTGTGVVKGRVVDGTTGAGVARARVVLQGSGSGVSPVVTDADGGFAFTGLPGGTVSLTVQKSTYLPARYPSGGRTMRSNMRPIVLGDGQVVDNVTVPIFHGASISGRVFDANGDPVESAQVSLMRLPPGGRTGKPIMRDSTQTNDIGEFRIGRLEAGTYLVQVSARRMEEPLFAPNAPAAPTPPAPQPLPTFYPGSLSMDQAQPIVIERAQALSGIDIVLAEGIPGIVSGTIHTADGQPLPPNTWPNVQLRRMVSDKIQNYYEFTPGVFTRQDGTFRAVVPPGEYTIEARLMPRTGGPTRPEDEQVGTARVSVVPGAEESLTLTVGPGASATGRVVFEGTAPPPPSPGRIPLPVYSDAGLCRAGEAAIGADWSFRVEGLSGTCSAEPSGVFGRWLLKAVIVNGENIMDVPVNFQPGQQVRNVQVIVTDRRSTVAFQVTDEHGQTTREYVAVLFPVDKERWEKSARTYMPPPIEMMAAMQSSSAPHPLGAPPMRPQTLSGLRAGDYYAVAVDDMEPEDPRDPVVLERLRSSATRVTIAEGATLELALRRVNFKAVMQRN